MKTALLVNTAGASTEILLRTRHSSAFYRDPDGRRASVVLLPKIDEMLDAAGLRIRDIELFGCCVGPGSFTGIRIGTVTMRTFSHRLHAPLLGINYHRLLAYNAGENKHGRIATVINGWGQNCYVSVFTDDLTVEAPPAAMTYAEAETLLAALPPYTLIVDEPAKVRLNAGTVYDPAPCMHRYLAAEGESAGEYKNVEPLYVLPSQAERDLNI